MYTKIINTLFKNLKNGGIKMKDAKKLKKTIFTHYEDTLYAASELIKLNVSMFKLIEALHDNKLINDFKSSELILSMSSYNQNVENFNSLFFDSKNPKTKNKDDDSLNIIEIKMDKLTQTTKNKTIIARELLNYLKSLYSKNIEVLKENMYNISNISTLTFIFILIESINNIIEKSPN